MFSNPSQTHRDCGLKGGNSRCQQKERKRPRKNQRRKRSTNALVRFTAPKTFRNHNQTSTREENSTSPPVSFSHRISHHVPKGQMGKTSESSACHCRLCGRTLLQTPV